MKRKCLSLLLTLAMCLSLTVTALADTHELYVDYPDGTSDAVVGPASGDGWSYDDQTNTLTLSGIKDAFITVNSLDDPPTIVLAPGSKNTLTGIMTDMLSDDTGYPVTFKGSGELIIYDADAEDGVFAGFGGSIKLQDGLSMTGGTKAGDSGALAFNTVPNKEYPTYQCMAAGAPAKYIRIAGQPSITGFTDVANDSPYAEAIKWAVDQKITAGKTAATFGPNDTCTLAHIITFLWRANGKPAPAADAGSDIDNAISWALNGDLKLIDQTDDTNGACTRAKAVYCMWLAAGQPQASGAASFSDVPAGAYYAQAVNWAVEQGITSGTSATTFSPGSTCTRGQIVTFLYRASK